MKPPPGVFTEYEEAVIETWEKYRLLIGERPHGTNALYADGCRCDGCKEAGNAYREAKRGSVPQQHGTWAAYTTHKCRCGTCVQAISRLRKERASRLRGTEPSKHGRHGYDLYGCRCLICWTAKSAYQAELRSRKALAYAQDMR